MTDAVEAPPKLHAGHVQDRHLSPVAGAPRGYRNRYESNLSGYASHGYLDGGQHTRDQRLEAGDEYRKLWETMCRSGRDSTDLDIVRGSGGTPISQAQADTVRKLIRIDRWLSQNDRLLVRWVCADGMSPAEAVRKIDQAYKDKTVPRFREAIDALIVAISLARP